MLVFGNTYIILILSLIVFEVESTGDPPKYLSPSSADTETVAENANPSTHIYVVIAIDNEGNTLTYSIHSQTPSSPSFTFDAASKKLYPPASLDAETTTSFAIEFSVSDGTSAVISPVLTINIQDVNEHSPDFNQTSYTASIYDTAANGDEVLTVFASDLDVTASLTYSITVGDTTTFTINSSSGAIFVATAGNLNAATTPSYTLTVQVSDTSTTDSASVIISVIDDPCSPNPCQNSGVCSQSGTSFTCTCQTGWIGATCTIDNPCLPNPCENSGNCSVSGTSYLCQCSSDYSGANCTNKEETGKDNKNKGGLTVVVIVSVVTSSVCVIVLLSVVFVCHKHIIKKKKRKSFECSYSKREQYKTNRNSVSPTDLSKHNHATSLKFMKSEKG